MKKIAVIISMLFLIFGCESAVNNSNSISNIKGNWKIYYKIESLKTDIDAGDNFVKFNGVVFNGSWQGTLFEGNNTKSSANELRLNINAESNTKITGEVTSSFLSGGGSNVNMVSFYGERY